MTVTQYIGARYVPLFAGNWDSTKQYEPLSIVLYQGNSYTSIQAVPTGIAITNTEYWAQTGNYNAQVEAYRQEVRNFDTRLIQAENDISAEETAREAADTALQTNFESGIATETAAREAADNAETAAREAADTAINARIDAINPVSNPYEYFSGYNAVFIGDSYAYGTGASDHLSGDTKRFTSILSSLLGATEFNFAVGSTGFCDPGSDGQNAPFATQVNNALAGMTNQQIADTHLVVIAGGVNDFNEGSTYGYSDMSNAAATCCARALTGFPNALIVTVPMLFKGHGANPRLLNFEDAIVNGVNGNVTGHKRCVSIRGAWTWNFGYANRFNADELHPNDSGHRNIANRIYQSIFGGVNYENSLEIPAWESGFSSSVASGGYFEFHDGVATMYGNQITGSLPAETATKIAAIPQLAPNEPFYGIIGKANRNVGTWQITQSGNIYCYATEAVTDFYLSPISWIPSGILN